MYQRPRDPFVFNLDLIDISGLPATERDAEVNRLAMLDARTDFDLSEDLLLRACILHLAADEHALLMNMHHIASDGWSMGVFFHELSTLYKAFRQGERDPLPPLSTQYADYAHWQRQWLQGQVLREQLDYWNQQLADAPPVHNLPLDYPRPEEQRFIGRALSRKLSASLMGALKESCQRCDVTLFMLLQSAFAVLLCRYSNEGDVVMGTPVAGRTHADTEPLIGFFINTLPLRTTFGDDASFSDVLAASKRMILDAYTHQQIPFEMLVEQLQPERSLRHGPLFQILFALQNNDSGTRELMGLELETIERRHSIIKFDLELIASERDGQLLLNWNYNTDLFSPASMERLADSYEALLRALVNDIDQPVADLPLLDSRRRHEVLVQSNCVEVFAPCDTCMHTLFERQVLERPDAIALVYEDQCLSYRHLNAKANQLAHYLIASGVRADALVGMCLDRGPEMVIGILAVLKAGGAYVPIDPRNPHDRIAYILSDSATRWLLSHGDLIPDLPQADVEALALDRTLSDGVLDDYPVANPADSGQVYAATQLAYVIYTSGSTGQPKGVLIQHDNVRRLFKAADRQFDFDANDVWTLFHAYTFDFSVWELWGALTYGGRLVVVPHWVARSTGDFHRLLRQQGVTVLNQTPSAFTRLIEADRQADDTTSLRYVIFGGEALNLTSLAPWFERHGDESPALINMYGITETTVHVTAYRVRRANIARAVNNSPIGRPLSDLSVYVLDSRNQLCPLGVAGELHVGGAGLARAYLNREQLTAERFIRNPIAEIPHKNLYKTGDLGRLLPDGNLEYVGRIDGQVKVRGFRIELGEIEHQLAACDGVKEALVMVRTDKEQGADDNKRLVAYAAVECANDEPLSVPRETALITEYRAHLQAKLPGYMVPAAFVLMPSLPLTINGKVDRKKLPAPDWSRFRECYVAPRNEVERCLAGIYLELLPVEQVGIDDGFFALGGDSISSIQLVAKARQHGFRLDVRDVFKHQTVRALAPAAVVDQAVVAEQTAVSGEVALTPVQCWFIEKNFSSPHHWNQAMLFKLSAVVDLPALQRTLDALVHHHDALRLYYPGGDWHAQAIAAEAASAPLRFEDMRDSPAAEAAAAMCRIADEEQARLRLDAGNLLRACLFRLPGGEHRLLVIIHHLAVDGVSWRILREDLIQAYRQAAGGESVKLPHKSHSYAAWSAQLRDCVAEGRMDDQIDYWREQAGRVRPLHRELEGRNLVRYSKVEQQRLSAELTEQLLQHVHRAYRTQINDVLLTALALAYHRWTGQSRLSLHMEGHGREQLGGEGESLDVSRTVGWFTSIFPLTLDLGDDDKDLAALLMGIKEQLRAVPNKGVGYGMLRYLHPDEHVRAALQPDWPVELSFNYLGQFQQGDRADAFTLASGDSGVKFAAEQERVDRLSVMASVHQGRLQVACQYSSECYSDHAVNSFIELYLASLTELIEHCGLPRSLGRTPSDYPLCRLDQSALDELRQAFGDDSGESLSAVYPLSSVQQGMLFHSRMDAAAGHYVVQVGLDIEHLDTRAFRRAWQQLADAHAILRTAFWGLDGDQPHQVVVGQVDIPWQHEDWSVLTPADQNAKWEALLAEDRRRGYAVEQAPLMRVYLIKMGDE
ncbi:MAG: amino acid adenylation domain-containing protein, partial [Wenzhouxiangellaceae bacterium]